MTALNQPTAACLCLALWVATMFAYTVAAPAPVAEGDLSQSQSLDLQNDQGAPRCYYNFQHYEEGDRIVTNEPCLNCTCHKRMLMCYLRVCPFTKPVGQNCTVEKRPDQCCPVITCPQVPVDILLSSSTTEATTSSAVGHVSNYGCTLEDNTFYPDGVQMPSDPKKPCELCYCIRNHTACVRQECTLNVEGCKPIYQEGVCCPIKYDCDYNEINTSTEQPTTSGLIVSSTPSSVQCHYGDAAYNDGEMIDVSDKPCQSCYCFNGDIVCAVRSCGDPLETNKDCTPVPPPEGQCCPTSYQCSNGTIPASSLVTEPSLALDSSDKQTEEPKKEFNQAEEENEVSTFASEDNSTMIRGEEDVPHLIDTPNAEAEKQPEQTIEDNIEDQSQINGEHIASDPVDGADELEEEDILAQTNLESDVGTDGIKHSTMPSESSDHFVPSSPDVYSVQESNSTIRPEGTGHSGTGPPGIEYIAETESYETQHQKENKPAIDMENVEENKGTEAPDFETNSYTPEVSPHVSDEHKEVSQPTQSSTDNAHKINGGHQESTSVSHPEVTDPGNPTENKYEVVTETPNKVGQESLTTQDIPEKENDDLNTEGNPTEGNTQLSDSETEPGTVGNDPISLTLDSPEAHKEQVSSESDKEVAHDESGGQMSQSEGESLPAKEQILTEEADKQSEIPDTLDQVLDSNNTNEIHKDDATSAHETETNAETVDNEHKPDYSAPTETNIIVGETVGASEESTLQNESLPKEPVPPRKDDSVPEETEPRPQHPQGSMTKAEDSMPTDPPTSVTLNTETPVNVDASIPSAGTRVETQSHSDPEETPDNTINHDESDEPTVETSVSQEQDHSEVTNESIPNLPEGGDDKQSESDVVPNIIVSEAESTEEPISGENYTPDTTPKMPVEIAGTLDHVIVFNNIDTPEQTHSPIETSETTAEVDVTKQTNQNTDDDMGQEENVEGSGHQEEDNLSNGQQTKYNPISVQNEEDKPTVNSDSSVSSNEEESTTKANEIGYKKEDQTVENEVPEKSEEQSAQNHETDKTPTVINVPENEIKQPTEVNEDTTEQESIGESNAEQAPEEPITEIQPVSSSNDEIGTSVSNELGTENNSEDKQVQESSEAHSTETAPEITSVSQDSPSSESEKKPTQDSFLITNEYEEVPHDPVESDPADIEDPIDENELPQVPSENEIFEDQLQGHGGSLDQKDPIRIPGPVGVTPGEGDCLVEGKTYTNNSQIPSKSPCHKECTCLSSIVHCQGIDCPPPPPQLANCMPVHQGDLCCPVYTCDGSIPEVPQSHNQMGTAEDEQQSPNSGTESSTDQGETTNKVAEPNDSLAVVTQESVLTNVDVDESGGSPKPENTENGLEIENHTEQSQTETPTASFESPVDGSETEAETSAGETDGGTQVNHDDNDSNSEHHSGEAAESMEDTTKKDETSEEAQPDSKPSEQVESQPIPVEDSGTNQGNDISSTESTEGETENHHTVLTDEVKSPDTDLSEFTGLDESPNKDVPLTQEEHTNNPNVQSAPEGPQTSNSIDKIDPEEQTTQPENEIKTDVISESTLGTLNINDDTADAESSTFAEVGPSEYGSGTSIPEKVEEDVVTATEESSNLDSKIGVNGPSAQDQIKDENAFNLPATEPDELVQKGQPAIGTSNDLSSHTLETPHETFVDEGSQNEATENSSHELSLEQPVEGDSVSATGQSEVNESMIHQDGQEKNEASSDVIEPSTNAPSEELKNPSDIVGISESNIYEEGNHPATESSNADKNEHEVEHPLNAEQDETATITLEGTTSESNNEGGTEHSDGEVSLAPTVSESETTEKHQPQEFNSETLNNENVTENETAETPEEDPSQTTHYGEEHSEGSEIQHENHFDPEVSTEGQKQNISVEPHTEVSDDDIISTERPPENSVDSHTAEPLINEDTISTEGYNENVQIPESGDHKSEDTYQPEEQNVYHHSGIESEPVGTSSPISSEEVQTNDIELNQEDQNNELVTLNPTDSVKEQDTNESDNTSTKPKEPTVHNVEQPIHENEQTDEGAELNHQTVPTVGEIDDKLPDKLVHEDYPTEPTLDSEGSIPEDHTSVHEEGSDHSVEEDHPQPAHGDIITEQTAVHDIESHTESHTTNVSDDVKDATQVSEVEIVQDKTTNKPVTPEEETTVVHENDTPSVALEEITVNENDKTEAPLEENSLDHKHNGMEVPVEEAPPVHEGETNEEPVGESQDDHEFETTVVPEKPSNTDHEPIPTVGESVEDISKPAHEHSELDKHEENNKPEGENTNEVLKPEDSQPETAPEASHSAAGFGTPDTNKPEDHDLGSLPDEFPPSGTDMDYDIGGEDGAFGPGTCRYGGKVYVSAQQIPRDDPCDFCFCFRSDIICLQQSCPPPIHKCHQEPIQGYCCPRYQCPVSMATSLNVTTTTTTTTTTLPPHFFAHAYQGAARQAGCLHKERAYSVGEEITTASGPCLQCICGSNGQMKCDPVVCSPEPMLRKMMEAAVSHRRR